MTEQAKKIAECVANALDAKKAWIEAMMEEEHHDKRMSK